MSVTPPHGPAQAPGRLPPMYFSADDSDPRATRPSGATRIMRGAWTSVRAHEPPWAQREQVTRARAVAITRLIPSARCLTHEAAALLHGLPVPSPEPDISIAVASNPRQGRLPLPPFVPQGAPAGTRPRQVYVIRRRMRLADSEVTTVDGIPVTNLGRTAIDCACDLPVRQSVIVLDAVLRRMCYPDRFTGMCMGVSPQAARADLLHRLEEGGRRRGIRRARTAIALASPWSESPGESVMRWVCAVAGVPAPVPQLRVVIDAGLIYFLDLGWAEERVALEFDGMVKYTQTSVLHAEKDRQMTLERAGWCVGRMTWADLRDVAAATDRVRRLLPGASAADAPALANLLR